jgi:hypothetical protein
LKIDRKISSLPNNKEKLTPPRLAAVPILTLEIRPGRREFQLPSETNTASVQVTGATAVGTYILTFGRFGRREKHGAA